MNSELYTAICDELKTLYGPNLDFSTNVLSEVNVANQTHYWALSQVSDYDAKCTLDALKAKVNEKVFNAEGVADPAIQKGLEL